MIKAFKEAYVQSHLHIWEDGIKLYCYPNITASTEIHVYKNFKIPNSETILYIYDSSNAALNSGFTITDQEIVFKQAFKEYIRKINWDDLKNIDFHGGILILQLKNDDEVNIHIGFIDHAVKLYEALVYLFNYKNQNPQGSKTVVQETDLSDCVCPYCGSRIPNNCITSTKESVDKTGLLGKTGIFVGKLGGKILGHSVGGIVAGFTNSQHLGHSVSYGIGNCVNSVCEEIRDKKEIVKKTGRCPKCGHYSDFYR